MKKLLLVFSVAWVVYCLINTGYVITQPKWRERLKQNPNTIQMQAGDIFNHGAFYIKNSGLNKPTEAVLFVEKDLGFLSALPLGYWLYPTVFMPASSNPMSNDNITIDSDTALNNLLAKPGTKTIYFVGHQKTLDDDRGALEAYQETPVAKEGNQVFYILEKNHGL